MSLSIRLTACYCNCKVMSVDEKGDRAKIIDDKLIRKKCGGKIQF